MKTKNRDFSFKAREDHCSLQVVKMADYTAVIELLKSQKIRFYTFTLKGEKPNSLFLRGFPNDYEETQLLGAINVLPIEAKATKAFKLGKNWRVQFEHSSNISNVL